jgi:hypothetical protein
VRRTTISALVTAAALAFAAPAYATTIVPLEGFEGPAPAWTMTGFWHVQDHPESISVVSGINPTLVTLPDSGALPAAFGGTRVAWFGQAATGTYCGSDWSTVSGNDVAGSGCYSSGPYSGDLVSPAFSLAGMTSALLTFEAWYEIESVEPVGHDTITADYSVDGGTTWATLRALNPATGPNPQGSASHPYSNNGLDQSPSWQAYSIDLSPAAGQASVLVRIRFDTGDFQFQGFRGVGVDDIAVTAADPQPQPMPVPVPQVVSETPQGLPPPIMGQTANATPESGQVFVKLPPGAAAKYRWAHSAATGFIPLSQARTIPMGSLLDTTRGQVKLTLAGALAGSLQDGHFRGGLFNLRQASTNPLTTLSLMGGGLSRCGSKLPAGGAARRRAPSRSLFSSVKGRFRTRGRNSSATVRGTQWVQKDTCAGTRTTVKSGTVVVQDFAKHRKVTLRAGKTYLARPPGKPRH